MLRFQVTPRGGQDGAGPKDCDCCGGGGAQKFLVAKRLTEEGRGGNERAVARGYLCL